MNKRKRKQRKPNKKKREKQRGATRTCIKSSTRMKKKGTRTRCDLVSWTVKAKGKDKKRVLKNLRSALRWAWFMRMRQNGRNVEDEMHLTTIFQCDLFSFQFVHVKGASPKARSPIFHFFPLSLLPLPPLDSPFLASSFPLCPLSRISKNCTTKYHPTRHLVSLSLFHFFLSFT